MNEQLIEKFKLLDKIYERLVAMGDFIKLSKIIVEVEFEIQDEWALQAFDYAFSNYKFDILSKIKKEFVSLIISELTRGLNISIDVDEVYKKFKDNFKVMDIVEYIEKNYLRKADELAFKQILERARNLVPYNVKTDDLVKKNRLILRSWHISDAFSDRFLTNIPWDFVQELTALERLAMVVLEGCKPSKAFGGRIANICWNKDLYSILKKIEVGPPSPIKYFRVYKNGKVVVWFETDDDARKVAEVLVNGKLEKA